MVQAASAYVVMVFAVEGQAAFFDHDVSACQQVYGLLRSKLDFPLKDTTLDFNTRHMPRMVFSTL